MNPDPAGTPTRVLVYGPKGADGYVRALEREADGLELQTASDPAEAERALADADVLLSSNKFPVELLAQAHRLRWIHVQGAGVNVWTAHGLPPGVRLTRTTGTFGPRMAHYVMTYVGVVSQRVRELLEAQADRTWVDSDPTPLPGRTLGVAGLGSIGRAIAALARAYGMRVVGFSSSAPAPEVVDAWFGPDRFHAFLAECDFVASALPLTPATTGLFDATAFAALPRHAWLVNVGRGPTVVERDLLAALERGAIGGAVLDVFETEPLPADHAFWGRPDVIVTPHSSGGTIEREVVDVFLRNLAAWRAGAPMEDEVDLTRAY